MLHLLCIKTWNNFNKISGEGEQMLTKLIYFLILCLLPHLVCGQETEVPDWALPGSDTHTQVSPPEDFHREARTSLEAIGIFDGQSDIGASLIPGSSAYDPVTNEYNITSAGYNVWYVRDEFRYLWKEMSGDISLAANIRFPDSLGYFDRKAVLVIRQSLEDDSREVIAALHGDGMIHLAWRPQKGERIKDMEFRIGSRGAIPGGKSPDDLVTNHAERIGIEKQGDFFALFVSLDGEAMHQFGAAIELNLEEPFYTGIGFCSHIPDKADSAILSDVLLSNKANDIR
jgi:hypothetical protein